MLWLSTFSVWPEKHKCSHFCCFVSFMLMSLLNNCKHFLPLVVGFTDLGVYLKGLVQSKIILKMQWCAGPLKPFMWGIIHMTQPRCVEGAEHLQPTGNVGLGKQASEWFSWNFQHFLFTQQSFLEGWINYARDLVSVWGADHLDRPCESWGCWFGCVVGQQSIIP